LLILFNLSVAIFEEVEYLR